jgi:hypothetical protein
VNKLTFQAPRQKNKEALIADNNVKAEIKKIRAKSKT